MSSGERPPEQDVVVGEEARKKAEQFVEQEQGAVRRFQGRTEIAVTAVAVAMSLYHLYAAHAIVPAYVLRATHVGFVLFLLFLLFPASKRFRPVSSTSTVSCRRSVRTRDVHCDADRSVHGCPITVSASRRSPFLASAARQRDFLDDGAGRQRRANRSDRVDVIGLRLAAADRGGHVVRRDNQQETKRGLNDRVANLGKSCMHHNAPLVLGWRKKSDYRPPTKTNL